MTASPRIAPLEPPYAPATETVLQKLMPAGMDPLALFRTLAVHTELASRMHPLGSGILNHGLIDPRQREVVIHRTCARCGAEYEWGVHVVAFARPLGFSEAQIEATTQPGVDQEAWDERQALLIRLADELYDTDGVSDQLWEELASRWGEDQLIELIVTAGWYRLLSYVINACRVPLEPWAERFPASGATALSRSASAPSGS